MVPIAGGYRRVIQCANWRHTPLWAFHGEADPLVDLPWLLGHVRSRTK